MSSEFLYIDPTTGGLGLQIVLGFLVGSFVTIKLWWDRFFSFFRKPKEDPAEGDAASVTPVSAETRSEN